MALQSYTNTGIQDDHNKSYENAQHDTQEIEIGDVGTGIYDTLEQRGVDAHAYGDVKTDAAKTHSGMDIKSRGDDSAKGATVVIPGVQIERAIYKVIVGSVLISVLLSTISSIIVYHLMSAKLSENGGQTSQHQAVASKTPDALTMEVNSLKAEMGSLSDNMSALRDYFNKGLRSTYIRWGRNICPGNAELIYKGYIGGKHFNSIGSGTDSVCLPSDPTWLKYSDGNEPLGIRAYIYGTEIDMYDFNPFDYPVHEEDMPCAVCSIPKVSSIMIPARNNCYTGWNLEYNGYLMTNMINRKGAYNHICMDVHPEFVPGGGQSTNQHILYVVEAQCGALPCPPYVQGRELACVVCSK